MLIMDDVNVIKFLYEKKGLKCAEIARVTEHDPRTVKKYVEKEDWNPEPPKRKEKPTKLDPFKDIIDIWLKDDINSGKKQRHTAKRELFIKK
jgi:transposase